MSINFIVNKNTYKVYFPSPAVLKLSKEESRKIRAENETWDEKLPNSLVSMSVRALVNNFENCPTLEGIPGKNIPLALELLSTAIPLNLTVNNIPDGVYWKRCAQSRWKSMNDINYHGNSWKRLYLERHLEEYIEKIDPDTCDLKGLTDYLRLFSPYVRRLHLRQLKKSRKMVPGLRGKSLVPDDLESNDHIDLSVIFKELTHLEDVKLVFGERDLGINFMPELFMFSITDCSNIAKIVPNMNRLKVFRVHNSSLTDSLLKVMIKTFGSALNIEILDFSYCHVSDVGCIALGEVLKKNQTIRELILIDNAITAEGAHNLAYALTKAVSPLKILNLRGNRIEDKGFKYLCSALLTSTVPEELVLTSCNITEASTELLARMLLKNTTLQRINLSNNDLGPAGGNTIFSMIKENKTLTNLDIRMTNIELDVKEQIEQICKRNREMKRDRKESLSKVKEKESFRESSEDDLRSEAEISSDRLDERIIKLREDIVDETIYYKNDKAKVKEEDQGITEKVNDENGEKETALNEDDSIQLNFADVTGNNKTE